MGRLSVVDSLVAGRMDARHPAQEITARRARRGVVLAAIMFLSLASAWSVLVPAQWGSDESSHAAYAYHAAHGRWPRMDSANDVQSLPGASTRRGLDRAVGASERTDIWTANHPPLYYAAVGIVYRGAASIWNPSIGLLAGRLLTVLIGVVGIGATGWLATILFPTRPALALLSAGLAALIPTLSHYAGQLYGDVLLFALSAIALCLATLMIRDGPSNRRAFALVCVAGALALTKSTGIVVAATGMAGVAGAHLARRRTGDAEAWRPGPVVILSAIAVLCLAATPYVVNMARYGEPFGSSFLLEKFSREPLQTWPTVLFGARFWLSFAALLFVEVSEGDPTRASRLVWLAGLWPLVPVLGMVGAVYHRWREHRNFRRWWVWSVGALMTVTVLLVLVSALWVSQGGALHARYIFPAVSVLAVLAAVGSEGLLRSAARTVAILVLWGLAATNGAILWAFEQLRLQTLDIRDLPLLVPGAHTVAAWFLALAIVALMLMTREYLRLTRATDLNEKKPSATSASAIAG